jgi:hypothetical protein
MCDPSEGELTYEPSRIGSADDIKDVMHLLEASNCPYRNNDPGRHKHELQFRAPDGKWITADTKTGTPTPAR